MKTDEELKKIALDLYSGKIFSDRHLNDPEKEIPLVFMIVGFMSKEDIKELESKEPVFVYEYLEKANKMGVNGYPTFFTMRYLNREEYNKMIGYHEKIKASINCVLEM